MSATGNCFYAKHLPEILPYTANTCSTKGNNHVLLACYKNRLASPVLNKLASSILHMSTRNKFETCHVSASYIRTSMVYLITHHDK
jgi:hypothetical protein